ncbi:glycosyltransferase family 1 protein [Patescibacteria group bacterium]|nr:MAG: glycosyltransferase family 1 protein [Patescibacteria group bacterium]
MRIGIDCRTILNPGCGEGAGVGHYVYFLVKNILARDKKNHYILFFDRRLSAEAARAFAGGRPKTEIVFFPFGEYKKYLPLAYSHLVVAGAIAEKKPDVFHLPAGILPLALKIPTVVTVHDLAIYSHPEWFPKQFFSVKVAYPRTIRSASRIIAVSAATATEVKKRFQIPTGRIETIYPGVDTAGGSLLTEDIFTEDDAVDWSDLARRYRLTKPYLLFLGTIEPRKNVKKLVEAYVNAWRQSPAIRKTPLLLAGAPGWRSAGALAAIRAAAAQTKGAVRQIGYVAHQDKFPLMRSAQGFVFPSLAEGFGLPVVEAMALGVPVLISDIPVFREVAGQNAFFVKPNSLASIAEGLIALVSKTKKRRQLTLAGRVWAKRYSWAAAARKTIKVYQKV